MSDGPLSHINLMLATPSADNTYCGDYVESLIRTKEVIEHFGGNMAWQKFPGCSDLCHARNKLLGNFVKMDQYTHLLKVDSVTGDTPILVRRKDDPWVDFMEIVELLPASKRFNQWRTYDHVNYEVLTHKGWQIPRAIMQAPVTKPILRISDEKGTVCVTEDHSLFSQGKDIAGRDIIKGTVLDHIDISEAAYSYNITPPMTEDYAEVLGFFAAEGTAGKTTFSGAKNGKGWFLNLSNSNYELLCSYKNILESVHARRCIFVKDCKNQERDPNHKVIWRLHISRPSDIVEQYINEFYAVSGKKKVPKRILNAPENIVRAFLRGYEKGDGHLTDGGLQVATTNSMILAAGLSFLYARVGRDFGVNAKREDKPSIISLYERTRLKIPPGVRHIQRDDDFSGWVYDLNTEAGTFVGGVGLFILHNSDMGWVADDVIRMLLLDKDFISGAGPKKQFPKEFCCSNRDDMTDEKIFPNFYHAGETLLCDMNYVGAGFVLISRNCAVKMTESYQDLAYFDSFDKQMEVGLYDPITITKNDGKYRYFDDFAFCYRWRMIGGKVVIVPDIRLKHTGNYTFEGQLTEMFEYGEEKKDGTGRDIGALQTAN